MLVASERLAGTYGHHVPASRVMARALPAMTNSESCKSCAMRQFCAMNPGELACTKEMDELVLGHRHVKKGEALYRVGDTFKNIYAVRTGSFKKLTLLSDGREQVTGFYLAGEPLGLDGISNGHYASDAIALEDSSVCVMPFELLELLSREVKAVLHHVYRLLSAEVVRESSLMMLLGTMTADERVASFLLDLSRRWQQRAYSPTQFVLRMTREETGSFLGIKLETVSRTLSRFQKDGLIEVNGKEVRILDLRRLHEAGHARC
ncbi:Crp/Fnr family transcriptional regulator [Trinickia caryophylli]|uniref:CRP/FNR family transcriptional regulator, anaerobic regulatory protein n=2 Tax=Trinickia caryophylli TaxID=28094 RepID=A0A1X7F8E3_TRICW|nr:Crp/Fnr family transcriptional regulator [Trinickia caryophylli]SMF47926.1 CRP/FNR family transcriptional regulator, anaerobic regulatory protein [Trinickia caryophylli]